MREKDRWDKCKCGTRMFWGPQKNEEVVCGKCGTRYDIECDSVLVYWLEEKIEPYRTNAK